MYLHTFTHTHTHIFDIFDRKEVIFLMAKASTLTISGQYGTYKVLIAFSLFQTPLDSSKHWRGLQFTSLLKRQT